MRTIFKDEHWSGRKKTNIRNQIFDVNKNTHLFQLNQLIGHTFNFYKDLTSLRTSITGCMVFRKVVCICVYYNLLLLKLTGKRLVLIFKHQHYVEHMHFVQNYMFVQCSFFSRNQTHYLQNIKYTVKIPRF